jgi:hypothetical protein
VKLYSRSQASNSTRGVVSSCLRGPPYHSTYAAAVGASLTPSYKCC